MPFGVAQMTGAFLIFKKIHQVVYLMALTCTYISLKPYIQITAATVNALEA